MNKRDTKQKTENFHHLKFKRIISFLIFIVLMGLIVDCFARAGGGGGFGGGSGGSSSGGGGEGEIIILLLRLVILYPKLGIPVIIVVAFLFYVSSKGTKNKYVSYIIQKSYSEQSKLIKSSKISELIKKDSTFSESSFLEKCNTYFLKVQKSWSERRLAEVRLILSDGVFERFSSYLNMQEASKVQNIVKDVSILSSTIVAVESDDFFDVIHVEITAKAIDYFINSDSRHLIYGSKKPEIFVEYWSFLRRPGAMTLEGKSLVDNFCPNCASPLTISDSTVCSSCSAVVNSGDYDWVLAEITQESEWRGVKDQQIFGLKELQGKDKAFNIQHIEDLTSVMFWKLREAEFFNSKKYLMKMCDSVLIDKFFKDRLESVDVRSFFADAAIGSVDVMSILVSENGEGYDEISVRIIWSGHLQEGGISDIVIPDYDKSKLFYHEFILQRNAQVKTESSHSLVSNHCIGCGAPQTVSFSSQCEYCGLNLNDGNGDWILKEVKPYNYRADKQVSNQIGASDFSLEGQLLETSVFSYETNIKLLSCMIAIMNADNVIDPSELALLYKMAEKRNISRNEIDALMESLKGKESGSVVFDSQDEVKYFFRAMIKMCLADGKVDSSERKLLKQIFSRFNYTDFDINQMIRKEQASEFKLAKNKLKAIRALKKS